ncbi:MAG: phosphate signaling complex protein PhoU [Calditrichaeota bacterium]|nr:phosphate signaling complex protein PhoU [Calditrichota bacterium]MCB9365743.1 phosphate signaling complex protein PhoU [Calditrichota bacterium]
MPLHLRRDLDRLKRKILSFGAAVEESAQLAVAALRNFDAQLANRVVARDEQINQDEVDIEDDCLKILALHQPVAVDLRYVITVLKINNDLERIADFSVNVAKRARTLAGQAPVALPPQLMDMAEKSIAMVGAALDSLVEHDAARARAVCAADDAVDDLQRLLYDVIVAEIGKAPDKASQWMQVFSTVRYFERMGDLATNIAEDVIYFVEGDVIRHQEGGA